MLKKIHDVDVMLIQIISLLNQRFQSVIESAFLRMYVVLLKSLILISNIWTIPIDF